jgi:hypothetical protein
MRRASSRPATTFDRKTERRFSLFQKCGRILGHAQRVGADGTHAMRIKTAQALAEALQAFERARLRIFVEAFLAVQTGAEANRLAQGIERVELVTDDARNLQMEGIGTEIDCGEGGVNRHVIGAGLLSVYARRLIAIMGAKYRFFASGMPRFFRQRAGALMFRAQRW